MKKNGTRPQRIAPEQVDAAVNEALMRVKQAEELSAEELGKVSGGSAVPVEQVQIQWGTEITVGLMVPEPDPYA